MATWPSETLNHYKGTTVIYVGEGDGGCTADKDFHRILEETFELEMDMGIPQFHGVHDYLSIWTRKTLNSQKETTDGRSSNQQTGD
jgi:hypothetical protein